MKRKLQLLTKSSLGAMSAVGIALSSSLSAEVNIIPLPNHVEEIANDKFEITKETAIRYDTKLRNEAELLAAAIEKATGHKPSLYDEKLRIMLHSQIYLDLDDKPAEGVSPESYTLISSKHGIGITGAGAAGAFYGSQSLLQLIPLEGEFSIPGVKIKDTPRFGWRGMHLDVGRHMFAPKDIKKFIDQLAVHKLNTMHWHLTEDQGWRIEIKKYPKLTEIGGFRASTPPYGNRTGSDGKRYGGFYTQEQIKDIVAYAQKRHITIVPEIDMPGHMAAAITAYPELGNTDIPNYNPKVYGLWGVHPYILAPKEETFKWIDDVLTELCELFPSTYIHIGGDEAPKGQWKQSPFAQSVMKREGLKNEHDLQSYFIGRLEKMLDAKGRKLIGWDEIREGGLSKNATLMLWRGWDHAIKSIQEGHDVVMAPGSHTYFDHYQNTPAFELAKGPEFECIGGHRTIESVYSFNPIPEQFRGTPKAKHVLGCQAQLWTEYMKTWDKVEYCAFPRIAALAEVAWSPQDKRDYSNFLVRLKPTIARYDKAGVRHFNPFTTHKIKTRGDATITTNMPSAEHLPEYAIDDNSSTFFWSTTHQSQGQHFTINLKKSTSGEIKATTGNIKHPKDSLKHGSLEISKDGEKFTKIAQFKNGVAIGNTSKEINYIRISVTKDNNKWLIIRDIEFE